MREIAIVTDSTAGIPPDLLKKYNITVAPLLIIWDNETYLDSIDMNPAQFYEMLPTRKSIPTTSQATIAAFLDIFKQLTDEGKDILVLTISSKLSGTMDSAEQAKAQFPKANIEIIDTLVTSVPLEMLVIMAAKAVMKGATMAQTRQLIEKAIPKLRVYFAVETLEYLHKGGRIGGASRFLGTALNLKPILELRDGKIEAMEKIRTSRKARERLVELIELHIQPEERINSIGIIHANEEIGAQHLFREMKNRFKADQFLVGPLSPVIGTHSGPGLVGVSVLSGLEDPLLD